MTGAMDISSPNTPYRVLARKYRPRHFDELVGQDALVRTLKNAISSGRLAQAYMLTGVRGVGKTTTARIIAKAINYVGPDGTSGPTAGPTDDCDICRAIAEDRHPDVLEMDAASQTGVDNMRDIIDSVRYAPNQARYKVYIIDEVHMLSKNAFAALLKTLEEPPPHVKFIFATTDIRKVPVTILSRCQRFDLRRFSDEDLKNHLADICAREQVHADIDALAMIARAGAGSARDGLSILDQALALGSGTVTVDIVKSMLGLVDQGRIADLLASALGGDIPDALAQLNDLDLMGGDARTVIEDLLGLTHQLIKARVTGAAMSGMPETLSAQTLPALSRAWQILLRSLQDFAQTPDPLAAAEMAIIRLGYASHLPDPGKLIKTLSDDRGIVAPPISTSPKTSRVPEPVARLGVATAVAESVQEQIAPNPSTLEGMVALLEQNGQMIVASQVAHYVRPIKLEPGHLEFMPVDGAPPRLSQDLGAALQQMTGQRWIIAVGRGVAQPTLAEQQRQQEESIRANIENDPVVRAVLLAFPGTKIEDITG
jgi:DNA polymerase III subunit gamma/tau